MTGGWRDAWRMGGASGSAFPGSLSAFLERRATWVAAIIALVAALATITSDPIGVFNDDGIYLLTAKALATGQGYVYPHLPGTPPAIHYPPIWPLVLAAAWKVFPAFPASVGWFKLINPVVIAVAAALAVRTGRGLLGLPWWVALGGVVAATVTVPVLLLTNVLLSEPLYLVVLLPTLWAAERLVRDGGVRWALVTAALVALLVLTRTLGIAVPVASVLLLARARRWRDLATFASATALLLLPWQLFVWHAAADLPDELIGSYGPYLEWVVSGYREGGVSFLKAVLAKNVVAGWGMLGILTSPFAASGARYLTAGLAILTFVGGLLVLARRSRAPVTALALVGYIAVVLLWPFQVDRFLWGLWPLIVLVALAGVTTTVSWLKTRGRGRAAAATIGVACLLAVGHETYAARGLAKGWEGGASRGMSVVGVRISLAINSDRSLDGQLIGAELAPLVALYTGLDVLPLEMLRPRDHVEEKTAAEFTAELEKIDRRFHPAAYVVMNGSRYHEALRAAHMEDGRTLVDESPPGRPVRTLRVRTP